MPPPAVKKSLQANSKTCRLFFMSYFTSQNITKRPQNYPFHRKDTPRITPTSFDLFASNRGPMRTKTWGFFPARQQHRSEPKIPTIAPDKQNSLRNSDS